MEAVCSFHLHALVCSSFHSLVQLPTGLFLYSVFCARAILRSNLLLHSFLSFTHVHSPFPRVHSVRHIFPSQPHALYILQDPPPLPHVSDCRGFLVDIELDEGCLSFFFSTFGVDTFPSLVHAVSPRFVLRLTFPRSFSFRSYLG